MIGDSMFSIIPKALKFQIRKTMLHIVQRYRSPSTYPPQTTEYHML